MDVHAQDGANARTGRGKRVRKDQPEAPKRYRRTIVMDDATFERLTIFALRTKEDKADVVCRLINTHCRRYVISDRGDDRPMGISAIEASPVNFSGASLPVAETLSAFPGEMGEVATGEGEGPDTAPPSRRKRPA